MSPYVQHSIHLAVFTTFQVHINLREPSVHVSQSSKGFKEYTASLSSAFGVGQNHMGLSKHIDLALIALKADTGTSGLM